MRVRLLGTAAGGGVPQWNCNCAVCREARSGTGRVRPRTQSSVVVSANGRHWFLLNASPDLRWQIENFPPLQPTAGKTRDSPIQAVLLTNADLDHTLGLLLLREGERLVVHAPVNVQRSLTDGLSLAPALDAFCGVQWVSPRENITPLLCRDQFESGLLYETLPLPGQPPRFMKGTTVPSPINVVGYRITDAKTGGRLLFLPDVVSLDDRLVCRLAECEALLFDGTFWSEGELQACGVGDLPASGMGHMPISGPGGSLKVIAQLRVTHKIYTHVNNTNPILFEDSPERAAVNAAGCVVGMDGMEITI